MNDDQTTEKAVKQLKAYGKYIYDHAENIVGNIDKPNWITDGGIRVSFRLMEHDCVPTLTVTREHMVRAADFQGGHTMTDNRTTELRVKRLRELLDERGIEHYDHENGEPLRVLEKAEEPATSWRANGASYCAVPDGKGTFDIWIDHCTPEQAISATLGSDNADTDDALALLDEIREAGRISYDDYSQLFDTVAMLGSDDEYEAKMDALLCRLTNGKWSKSKDYDLDFMESCVNEEFENLYAKELADATLGNGTLTAEQVRKAVERHGNIMDNRLYEDWQAVADELNAKVGGTCKLEKVKDYKQGIVITAWGTLCSECGAFYEFIDGRSWNCCPMCMRKAVDR